MTRILILGGTAWLGRELVRAALLQGHEVTCLARGSAGTVPDGVEWIQADRGEPDAYAALAGREFDDVVEISWQPGWVRAALTALGARAAHWTLVSSVSVYAAHDTAGADESAAPATPLEAETATIAEYAEAKSACEAIVLDAVGDRAALARVGLIGGPGDGSDRTTYWPGRFALAGSGPVLVPDSPETWSQVIDVRDLADFLLRIGRDRRVGPVNVVGEQVSLASTVAAAHAVAGGAAEIVTADPEWLVEQGVRYWAGPRSLPLWMPTEDNAGSGTRSDARALDWGLVRRPLTETFTDCLPDEAKRDPDGPRRSGLTRAEELELIAASRSGGTVDQG